MYRAPISPHPHVAYFLIAKTHEYHSPAVQDLNALFGNVMNYIPSLISASLKVIMLFSLIVMIMTMTSIYIKDLL